MAEAKNTRSSRETGTHDKQSRRQPWRPVRKLEAPPAPPGFVYRWIRESMLGDMDAANVSRRLREGWELVKSTDLPAELRPLFPALESGRHAGVVHNEGLLLAKMPQETVDERNDHYAQKNVEAIEALDNNVFNEAARDGRYVKFDPKRSSSVTFGKQ